MSNTAPVLQTLNPFEHPNFLSCYAEVKQWESSGLTLRNQCI